MLPNPIGSTALFCGHSRSAPTIGVVTTPIYSPLVRSNQAWGRAAAAHTNSEANEVQTKVLGDHDIRCSHCTTSMLQSFSAGQGRSRLYWLFPLGGIKTLHLSEHHSVWFDTARELRAGREGWIVGRRWHGPALTSRASSDDNDSGRAVASSHRCRWLT